MRIAKYRAPGVYFEPIDPAPRYISEVRSDIVGFVGVAERGPLHRPVKVQSWTQYLTRFGGRTNEGLMPFAVFGFFENGGRTCWIVRVGRKGAGARKASLVFTNFQHQNVLRVTALDYGPGAEKILIRIKPLANSRFSLFIRRQDQTAETWHSLSMDPNDPRYFGRLVNGNLVEPEETSETSEPAEISDEYNRETLPSFRGSVLIR